MYAGLSHPSGRVPRGSPVVVTVDAYGPELNGHGAGAPSNGVPRCTTTSERRAQGGSATHTNRCLIRSAETRRAGETGGVVRGWLTARPSLAGSALCADHFRVRPTTAERGQRSLLHDDVVPVPLMTPPG